VVNLPYSSSGMNSSSGMKEYRYRCLMSKLSIYVIIFISCGAQPIFIVDASNRSNANNACIQQHIKKRPRAI
jgi:hypothetical protein